VTWDYLAIIVDGLNGAAGQIHLTFDYGLEVPVCEDSWGRVKSRFSDHILDRRMHRPTR
jgi:hypothetical protein